MHRKFRALAPFAIFILLNFNVSARDSAGQPARLPDLTQDEKPGDVPDGKLDGKPDEKPDEWPHTMASGTLPIVYINTEKAAPIVDKETKIPATLYITVPEDYDREALGSAEKPVELTIKGRGNASWTLPQKPYKLKFEKKAKVLGMPKHKHFAMIPYAPGIAGWLASYAGMELGRMAGMPWTPHLEPCELVLNGRYDGLYFMVESMKIDENRINIFEQEDQCTDPEMIQGGWLVEIDNYPDEYQIVIPETADKNLRVTHKSPEELSDEQREYLIGQFTLINEAIYSGDPTGDSYCAYIDVNSLARYFIVREILHDTDGYNGSFYLHKDLGEEKKWTFGPLWDLDFGGIKTDWIMNQHPSYSVIHWIEPIFDTLAFRNALRQEWEALMEKIDDIYPYITEFAERCTAADKANNRRWPDRGCDTPWKAQYLINGIKQNVRWIDNNLPDPLLVGVTPPTATSAPALWFNMQGIETDGDTLAPGLYIRIDAKGAHKVRITR